MERFHIKLGDAFLANEQVTAEQLERALLSVEDGEPLEDFLVSQGIISEEEMFSALANIKRIPYVEEVGIESYCLPQFAPFFDEALMREMLAVPLLRTQEGFVFAFSQSSPTDARRFFEQKYGIEIKTSLMSTHGVKNALNIMYGSHHCTPPESLIFSLYEKGYIDYEQVITAVNYKAN